MEYQIIKQPKGKYCIWSSCTDSIVCVDMEFPDLVAYFAEDEVRRITKMVQDTIAKLNKPKGKPYYQFTKSFEEAVEDSIFQHGPDCDVIDMLIEEDIMDGAILTRLTENAAGRRAEIEADEKEISEDQEPPEQGTEPPYKENDGSSDDMPGLWP